MEYIQPAITAMSFESLLYSLRIYRLTRLNVLNVIEASIFEQLNSFITRRGSPAFQFPNFHSKKNVTFVPEHGLRPINWEETPIELSAVKFDVQTSEKKYIRMMHVLNKIHELLVNNEFITKRQGKIFVLMLSKFFDFHGGS